MQWVLKRYGGTIYTGPLVATQKPGITNKRQFSSNSPMCFGRVKRTSLVGRGTCTQQPCSSMAMSRHGPPWHIGRTIIGTVRCSRRPITQSDLNAICWCLHAPWPLPYWSKLDCVNVAHPAECVSNKFVILIEIGAASPSETSRQFGPRAKHIISNISWCSVAYQILWIKTRWLRDAIPIRACGQMPRNAGIIQKIKVIYPTGQTMKRTHYIYKLTWPGNVTFRICCVLTRSPPLFNSPWSSLKKLRFRKFWRSYLDKNLLRITNPVSDLTGDQ
jgi:hypothetical protein